MRKIGITGNIGSGKSTVCEIFEVLGIPVYYADNEAKKLMHSNENLIAGIKALFGEEAYLSNGELNRKWIASIAFKDSEKLKGLNSLVHPAVREDSKSWFASIDPRAPYALKEAALIIESGSYKQLDKLILVRADQSLRLQRVMKRDGVDPSAVEARMDKQMPESEKLPFADYVINNNESDFLIPQVIKIHEELSRLA